MDTILEYRDISLEEEAALPLPSDWARTMKLSLGHGGDSSEVDTVYRNIVTGIESEEHPLLVKALNLAR